MTRFVTQRLMDRQMTAGGRTKSHLKTVSSRSTCGEMRETNFRNFIDTVYALSPKECNVHIHDFSPYNVLIRLSR